MAAPSPGYSFTLRVSAPSSCASAKGAKQWQRRRCAIATTMPLCRCDGPRILPLWSIALVAARSSHAHVFVSRRL